MPTADPNKDRCRWLQQKILEIHKGQHNLKDSKAKAKKLRKLDFELESEYGLAVTMRGGEWVVERTNDISHYPTEAFIGPQGWGYD